MNQQFELTTTGRKISILSTFGVSFFIWGVITFLNVVLTEHLKSIFHLNYSISALINLTFFTTYLVVALPAGKLIKSWGYKLGLIIGLFTTGLGCMLFYFAIYLQNYYFFLGAMAVQAAGITLLQVGANLYILFFGSKDTAVSRLTLMQGLNALGAFLAPVYSSSLVENFFGVTAIEKITLAANKITALSQQVILKSVNQAVDLIYPGISTSTHAMEKISIELSNSQYLSNEIIYVQSPYIILSIIMYILTIFFVFVDIPEFSTQGIEPLNRESVAIRRTHVMHFKQLRLGAFAIFAYLGAEVSMGKFFVTFYAEDSTFYWGAAILGRIVGAIILLKVTPRKILYYASTTSCILLAIAVMTTGEISIWAAIAIGFFNAVMFPCIYALGVNGLGKFSEDGSAIMIMAFVGAGVIPFNALNFATAFGDKVSFIFPFISYVYVLFYAKYGSKFRTKKDPEKYESFSTSLN